MGAEMKNEFNPALGEFSEAEREILLSRLKAIRSTVHHAGEKGRTVEADVRSLLSLVLPARYGLATGFIAYHTPECVSENPFPPAGPDAYRYDYDSARDRVAVSTQLDLIIYDSVRFAPIVDLGTAVVLPLEAVIAYVEVKTQLRITGSLKDSSSLATVLDQSKQIRSVDTRLFMASVPGSRIMTAIVPYPRRIIPQIRSFVFALETSGCNLEAHKLAEKMTKINRRVGGFLSGLFIADRGFFTSRFRETVADKGERDMIFWESDSPLATFKTTMLSSLSRFGSYPEWLNPAFHRYFTNDPKELSVATLHTPHQPVSLLVDNTRQSLMPHIVTST